MKRIKELGVLRDRHRQAIPSQIPQSPTSWHFLGL